MNEISSDSIMDWFKAQVEDKKPLSPSIWLDGAHKVNALLSNLDDDLVEAEMGYNELLSQHVSEGETYSAAKTFARSSDQYRKYLKLKAKKERAVEFIRLAKKQTGLPQWDQ